MNNINEFGEKGRSKMLQGTLIPKYMKDFKCIGGECEDTCCSGWTVTIDKKTYKKYQKLNDNELRTKLKDNVKRIKKSDIKSDELYARFIMGSNGCCSLLTEDKWCHIQKELGEEALSVTCQSYPRNLNKVDDNLELSARVSCPEVARLALLQPNGIEFESLDFEINPVWPLYRYQDSESSKGIRSYFWPVRMLAIEILQSRQISLGDRMLVLGMFINALQTEINNANESKIPQIIELYQANLKDSNFLASICNLNTNLDVQLQVLFELIKYRTKLGIESDRYLLTMEEMIAGFNQVDENSNFDSFKESYKTNFNEYYFPYMQTKEYILENYVVNLVYNLLFPSSDGSNSSLFDEFVIIATLYALLKIHLVGVSGKHKALDDELVIRVVQSYAKVMEHNNRYIRSVLEELKLNNYYSLAHVSVLVKDMKV